MIYFDNAATTGYKPPEVIQAVNYALTHLSANPGRSAHRQAIEGSLKMAETREKIAKLVGCPNPDNVVFSLNCTTALNQAILGSVTRGCHIISSLSEHNSVLRPLFELKRRGIAEVSFLVPDKENKISPLDVQREIKRNTRMVVLGHISNVTGAEQEIEEIGKITKNNKLIFIVDGAQSVGYADVNMEKQNIDLLAFPAHKGLHGIMGLGCLCFKDEAKPTPILYGGTGTDSHLLTQPTTSPECFESGTQNLPAILGLNAAIDWYEKTKNSNAEKRKELAKMLYDGLHTLKKVTVLSCPNFKSGIVSFKIEGIDSMTAADILAEKYEIAVRSGLHCAPLIHKHLGTDKEGLVRASVSAENNRNEVITFLRAIKEISE